MKIPGLWRLSHLNQKTKSSLTNHYKSIQRSFYFWKNKNKTIKRGVNLIGQAKGDFGMGEHLRLVTNAIKTTSIDFCINNFQLVGGKNYTNNEVEKFISESNPYQINLFCLNTNNTLEYMQSYKGRIASKKHYNIGYGYWELSKYPKSWHAQDAYLQEIWAPSTFLKEMLERESSLPVYYMPVPIDFNIPEGYSKRTFNLPEEDFIFLFTFALTNYPLRKNPDDLVDAFQRAFPKEKKENVLLVLKINRIKDYEKHTRIVEKLQEKITGDKRIIIMDELLSRPSILGLINSCDCYVSLHKAEGLGFGMAEAMKMGKPVIATNYSGNLDFMNDENSFLVDCTLENVKKEEFLLVEEGAVWAKPSIEHAANHMRNIYENPTLAEAIGKAAQNFMNENFNFKTIGDRYRQRITEIQKTIPMN